jgi:pimeloyl-ACP methyl ester carboxylesterase
MTVLLAALTLLVFISLLVAGVTYALFYRALVRSPSARFAQSCQGRGVACLCSGFCTSCVSQFVMFLTYPLGVALRARQKGGYDSGEPVVVCLHGLYHNPAAFLAIRPALVRSGLGQVFCPGYRWLGTDFESEAARLLGVLRETVPGETPLLFLGHSLGGLFIRRLVAEPDIARRTLAVVTMGTPHKGSGLAALAFGGLGRALLPGGPIVTSLDALSDPSGTALLALVSPVDNIVIPLAGLDIDRPRWRVETTPAVSHVAMLYHPAVIFRAVLFLGEAARSGKAATAVVRTRAGQT